MTTIAQEMNYPVKLEYFLCFSRNMDKSSNLANLSTRQYLDQTVAPLVLQGLNTLAKERPQDPITYLANFLLKNKNKVVEEGTSSTNGEAGSSQKQTAWYIHDLILYFKFELNANLESLFVL